MKPWEGMTRAAYLAPLLSRFYALDDAKLAVAS
jgi:hypothetical protein